MVSIWGNRHIEMAHLQTTETDMWGKEYGGGVKRNGHEGAEY